MNVQTKTNGGPVGINRKFPDEHGYVANMDRNLYNPEVFSDVSFDTLRRYQQCHDSLN